MKTCPVCHARCFDDMEVCYGCLHRFGDEGALCAEDFDDVAEAVFDIVEQAAPSIGADGDDEVMEHVKATVRPSRGMHGAMVVRIEIPASMIRFASVEAVPEAARR